MKIIENGSSRYVIYLDPQAIASEQKAAEELQAYLARATGVTLPIVRQPQDTFQLVVGASETAHRLLAAAGATAGDWRPDEIAIVPVDGHLVLTGARPRGALYAVYTFLEDQLGVRFWTATEQHVPQLDAVRLPTQSYRHAPDIAIRLILTRSLASHPAFAAQSRVHGPLLAIPEEWGGGVDLIGPWHTFDRFLPAEEYMASHPEYFSLRDGQRIGGQYKGQLCLSNPGLRERFLAIVLEKLHAHADPQFISITQNDNFQYCQCEACEQIDQAGGGPAASMITFANVIAEGIAESFPKVIVQTFAYQYTRQMPVNVVPHPNVSIFFSTIEADFSKPLTEERVTVNREMLRDMRAWSGIAERIDVWDYITNFSNGLQPHPNLEVAIANIKAYAANKPHMVLMEGDMQNPQPVSDLEPLKTWVLAQMLWRPDAEGDALIDTFLEGYYGPAAPDIRAYLTIRREAAAESSQMVGCFTLTVPWLNSSQLFEGLNVLAQARARVAEMPDLLTRVDQLAKSFEYLFLVDYDFLRDHPDCPPHAEVVRMAEGFLTYLDERAAVMVGAYEPIENTRGLMQRRQMEDPPAGPTPAFLAALQGQDHLVVEESALVIHNGTRHARIVRDERAMNGWAVEIDHDATIWAIKIPFRPELSEAEHYRVYGAFRLSEPATQGLHEFGAYDWEQRTQYASRHLDADTLVTDAYTYLPMGTWRFRSEGYLFLSEKVNPQIQRSYLDHVVFVKE